MNEQNEQNEQAEKAEKVRNIRPAIIVSQDFVSDYSSVFRQMMLQLASQSIKPVLICPPEAEFNEDILQSSITAVYPKINLPGFGHYNRSIILDILKRESVNFIHCLCPQNNWLAGKLARKLNVPYIINVNSTSGGFSKFTISAKRCLAVLAATATIAENFKRHHRRLAGRVEVINYGYEIAENITCFSSDGRLPTIATCHPIDKYDDFADLILALKQLYITGHEFMFVVEGTGANEDIFRREVLEMGLMNNVVIVEPKKARNHLILSADIYVQPVSLAKFEPIILEAMANGLAVIAPKGGVDDFIIDGENAEVAEIFDGDNPLSLRNALEKLISQHDIARELATNARRYIKDNYNVVGMNDCLMRLYMDAAGC